MHDIDSVELEAKSLAGEELKWITVYNTSYMTGNLGDQIIMEAVDCHLRQMFPLGFFTGVPVHDQLGPVALATAASGDYAFVGGTNLLASHWLRYHQLKLRLRDIPRVKPFVLMGVGWHKYQSDPDVITRMIYRRILSREHLHSVRDRYTRDKLHRMGIRNVVYTGCPTMWELTPDHLAAIPTRRASRCLMTLTAYHRDERIDRQFVDLVVGNYNRVYFWPQMFHDLAYLREIATEHFESGRILTLRPSLSVARETLRGGDIDYLGSRLHCGVLALQNKVRTLVVAVDNRATEISRDTGLPITARDDFDRMREWIKGSNTVALRMPLVDIAQWKGQFAADSGNRGGA